MKRLLLLALVAGCATPMSSAVVVEGEAAATAGTVSTEPRPTPAWIRNPTPRPVPSKAARTRPFIGLTASGSGQLTRVTCYVWTGHRTASGKWPRPDMAASNRHPFGTRLRVQGVGVVTVEDRIGWGSDLDLYMTSHPACIQFGRQRLRVQVIR